MKPDADGLVPCPKCPSAQRYADLETEERRAWGFHRPVEPTCYFCCNEGRVTPEQARTYWCESVAAEVAFRLTKAEVDRDKQDPDAAEMLGETLAEMGSELAMSGQRVSMRQVEALFVEDRSNSTARKLSADLAECSPEQCRHLWRVLRHGDDQSAADDLFVKRLNEFTQARA